MRKRDKKEKAYRFGLSAERLARFYLMGKGYRILAERYRNSQGEIDILARKGNVLVAVEVKARQNLAQCEESVTEFKQQKIIRAMEGLLAGQGNIRGKIAGLVKLHERDIRFDVIWIVPKCWPKHIKDAWRL